MPTVLRLCARRRTWAMFQGFGVVLLVAAALVLFLQPHASAASGPQVTVSPAGPYANGATVMVSGSGFPGSATDPSGVSILECSDAQGLPANLPMDDSGCDGSTVNPLPISVTSTGSFGPVPYTITALSTSTGNAINCDESDECVLWVGVDYVNAFESNFAFSNAFVIQVAATTTTTTTTTPSTTTTTSPTSTTTAPTTTTTASTTTTTSPTSTTTSPTTTTTGAGGTTTSSTSSTTTTSGAGGTTTTTIVGGVTTSAPPTGGTGTGSTPTTTASAVAANSSQLAFTGPPTSLPWLIGFGVVLLLLGSAGRRLVPGPKP